MPNHNDRPRLADVDGTTPGRAVLMTVNPDEPENPKWANFTEDRDDPDRRDPVALAWGLWESIKGDWPGHVPAVVANERGKYLAYARRIRSIGLEATPEKYLEARTPAGP